MTISNCIDMLSKQCHGIFKKIKIPHLKHTSKPLRIVVVWYHSQLSLNHKAVDMTLKFSNSIIHYNINIPAALMPTKYLDHEFDHIWTFSSSQYSDSPVSIALHSECTRWTKWLAMRKNNLRNVWLYVYIVTEHNIPSLCCLHFAYSTMTSLRRLPKMRSQMLSHNNFNDWLISYKCTWNIIFHTFNNKGCWFEFDKLSYTWTIRCLT